MRHSTVVDPGPRMGRGAVALGLALALPLGGCDDDAAGPDGGDDTGIVEAFVTDDPQSASPSIGGSELAASLAGARAFTGTASGNFQVSISAEGDTWIDLGSLNGISVTLQSTDDETSVHGEQSVPVGTYSRVRLILEGVDAELDAGSQIGGLTLGLDTSVSLGGAGQVVIVRTVTPFTVRADAKARLGFDLNSEAWLTESAVTLGSATSAEVEAHVAAAASVVAG